MAQGTVQVTHTGTSRWRRRTGEYASLAAALEAASDGDVLVVAPGTYRENLVVRRGVTLRGPEGSPGSVRIAPVDGVPLTVSASAVVQDLHVEGQDAAAPALLVEDGTPELLDLRIVTRSAAGIEVRGGARPTVRRCTVDNPAGIGIAVVDGGGGVFEECEVVAAGQAGVAVRGGGHPRLERCRVHHTSGSGLTATGENSALEAVGCEVYEVRGSGVQITGRATAHLTDCDVHRTTADGITLDTDAVLHPRGLPDPRHPGKPVDLRSRSVLTLTRTSVRQFGRNGLSVVGTRHPRGRQPVRDLRQHRRLPGRLGQRRRDGGTGVLPRARRAGRAVRAGPGLARGRRRQRSVAGAQHRGVRERRGDRAARRLPDPGRRHGRLVSATTAAAAPSTTAPSTAPRPA
ncbi:right-handed parallel beta-helix repeat-containing protein [Streptomyces stelliscabiei]